MTLPPCPLCGNAPMWSVAIHECDVRCTSPKCPLNVNWVTKAAWLALCSRLLPAGHVAVPESEIEALRAFVASATTYLAFQRSEHHPAYREHADGCQKRGDNEECIACATLAMADYGDRTLAIVAARLPRKVDHVAALEVKAAAMRNQILEEHEVKLLAALEAAIVRMRESAQ